MDVMKPKGNRAAIYVRVSSEQQAEEVSPDEQELDCRRLAEQKGYTVVDVYRETEKYRVGRRLVEPSATRNDRPQFRRMIADADAGYFDVLLVWREDRLYRGVTRSTLDITDRVKNGVFTVELVNGIYNPGFAPVMAWAAGIELEAKNDRHRMGVLGRLKKGGIWCTNPPFGYDLDKENKTLKVNEEEAQWVRLIKEMSARGASPNEIRAVLIAKGAKQKESHGYHRKHVWSPRMIRLIIYQDYYATGQFPVKWYGQSFIVQIPTIVPMSHQQAINIRREQWRQTHVGHVNKGEHLFVGKVYCAADQVKMGLHRDIKRRTFVKGRQWEKEYIHYRCNGFGVGLEKDGCARQVRAHIVEEMAWAKIWEFLSIPDAYENLIQERINALTTSNQNAYAVITDMEARLKELDDERQAIYTLYRKKKITEIDMDRQLANITVEENAYRSELSQAKLASQRDIGDLERLLNQVKESVVGSINLLRTAVISDEDAARQWQLKKYFVDNFVEKVLVYKENSRADSGFDGRGGSGLKVWVDVVLVTDLERYVISDMSSRWHVTDPRHYMVRCVL